MNRKSSKSNPDWKRFLIGGLPLESECSFFLLLSTLDVLFTYFLLRQGSFQEANPIARYFIYGWGIKGMVVFKYSLAAFTLIIVQVIALSRLEVARRIIQFGILVVLIVVVYSANLLIRAYNLL